MKIIRTAAMTPNMRAADIFQIYNGLDCCLTFEIWERLSEMTAKKPAVRNTYSFERAMQAPALEMMERGWLIDKGARDKAKAKLKTEKARLLFVVNEMARAVWDKGLNANSPAQLKEFFYGVLKLPEQYAVTNGVRRVSTNRDALENLSVYFYSRPIINTILALRETAKKLSVLETNISADGRIRTSYNVAGTETGRWSSSSASDGSGTNLQNITPELRDMFIADPGWKLCYLDLEQAESRVVGLLVFRDCADPTYLDACESGDLHTTVSKLVWPALSWGGNVAADKMVAEHPFYRHFSYRDMAKRGGHGTNYYGTPRTMARHLKVEEAVMVSFQNAYFKAFPGIRTWHQAVAMKLARDSAMITLLGRPRTFFGRSNDDSTLREAIAFEPQSVVGDLLNLGLWRLWRYEPRIQILGQVHDAVVFQYPDNPATETSILNSALSLTAIPITSSGRTLIIPSECKVGWNWANASPSNLNGLVKWKGTPDERRRLD